MLSIFTSFILYGDKINISENDHNLHLDLCSGLHLEVIRDSSNSRDRTRVGCMLTLKLSLWSSVHIQKKYVFILIHV